MSKPEASAPGMTNWDPPKKKDIVERAVSDGTTDPDEIVKMAKNYKVEMSVEEVKALIADLKKK